jgi:hypothetical protein
VVDESVQQKRVVTLAAALTFLWLTSFYDLRNGRLLFGTPRPWLSFTGPTPPSITGASLANPASANLDLDFSIWRLGLALSASAALAWVLCLALGLLAPRRTSWNHIAFTSSAAIGLVAGATVSLTQSAPYGKEVSAWAWYCAVPLGLLVTTYFVVGFRELLANYVLSVGALLFARSICDVFIKPSLSAGFGVGPGAAVTLAASLIYATPSLVLHTARNAVRRRRGRCK